MPNPILTLPDEPTDSSISALTRHLRSDSEKKGVSPKNYAHRARVIRQQKELLARGRPDQQATYAADQRQSDAQESTVRAKHLEPQSFTIFSSAKATCHQGDDGPSAEDNWDNEGGHMSSTSGAVKHVPASPLPFVATLSHHQRDATRHPFATMREAEAFIRRNTPVPERLLATTYDRPSSDPQPWPREMESTMNDETILARLKVIDERLRRISSSEAASVLAGGLAQAGIHEHERLHLIAETERILDELDGHTVG